MALIKRRTDLRPTVQDPLIERIGTFYLPFRCKASNIVMRRHWAPKILDGYAYLWQASETSPTDIALDLAQFKPLSRHLRLSFVACKLSSQGRSAKASEVSYSLRCRFPDMM